MHSHHFHTTSSRSTDLRVSGFNGQGRKPDAIMDSNNPEDNTAAQKATCMDGFASQLGLPGAPAKKQDYAPVEQQTKIADLVCIEEELAQKALLASLKTNNRSSTKHLSMDQVWCRKNTRPRTACMNSSFLSVLLLFVLFANEQRAIVFTEKYEGKEFVYSEYDTGYTIINVARNKSK